MRTTIASLLVCGVSILPRVSAQEIDAKLLREVAAVQKQVASSRAGLHQYTWTEHTEVLIKGEVKQSKDLICRHNNMGELTKTPTTAAKQAEKTDAVSKRPINRKKAEMEDYIERTISLVHSYLPPKPEQMEYLLTHGYASLGQAESGAAEIRFKRYLKEGDSLVFVYNPLSKALLRISISSYLGSEKDPVTLEAVFETLPGGVTHLATADLNGKAKKIQVKTRNTSYQRVAD